MPLVCRIGNVNSASTRRGGCSDMDDGLLGGGNCGFTQSSTTSKELYENVVQREHACMYGPAGTLFHLLPNDSSSCS